MTAVVSLHAVTPRPASPASVEAATHAARAQEVSVGAVESHTKGVPQLSSRPGAPYTIYLDVAGFNFDGAWYADSGNTYTPGFTPSLNDASPTGTFTATEQTQIKTIWARVTQSYIGLNVNVTTVDPYAATNDATPSARITTTRRRT